MATWLCVCCLLQVIADERVNAYFQGKDMVKQRAHQVRG